MLSQTYAQSPGWSSLVLGQESLLPEYHMRIRTRALVVCPLLSHSSLSLYEMAGGYPVHVEGSSRATVRGCYDAHGGPTNAKLQELLLRAVHTQCDSWATYGWGRQGYQSIPLGSDPPWWLRRPNWARYTTIGGEKWARERTSRMESVRAPPLRIRVDRRCIRCCTEGWAFKFLGGPTSHRSCSEKLLESGKSIF